MKRYRMRGRVVVRRIGEDSLLVPISGEAARAGGRVYPVNQSALTAWTALAEGGTVEQAAKALTDRFDVSERDALVDSEACAMEFLKESLLEETAT